MSDHRPSSHFLGFRAAMSRIILQIMRKNPKLNSLAWDVILRSYDLPPFAKVVAFASGFTMIAHTQFGLLRFRPVFVNEILMALELYEPAVKEVFKPRKGQTVLDIGSNIGVYTLRASSQVGPTGIVVSIEANPDTFRILKTNVMANYSDNIILFCCAAGAEDGSSDLYVPSNYAAGSTMVRNPNRFPRLRARVPVRAMDSLVAMVGIKRVDWIKIDVEGAEEGVVAGCKNVIRNHKPQIIIETMNQRVVQFLRENGYDILPVGGHTGLVYARPNFAPAGISHIAVGQRMAPT